MENITRKIGLNAAGRRVGQDHHAAELTDSEIELIRELYDKDGWKKTGPAPHSFKGWTLSKLAKKFDVPKSTISGIISFKRRNSHIARFKDVRISD